MTNACVMDALSLIMKPLMFIIEMWNLWKKHKVKALTA